MEGKLPLLMRTVPESILNDLAVGADPVTCSAGDAVAGAAELLLIAAGERLPDAGALATAVRVSTDGGLDSAGSFVVHGVGSASSAQLAALRNGLWPALHLSRVYRQVAGGRIERQDHSGGATLEGAGDEDGWAVVGTTRAHAMSPEVTAVKFDGKASGWNGDPASPSYGHFRWMRRLLAELAEPRAGESALDAGSGAGWVGVEAAIRGARISAFDPSPEMVKFVEQNARDNGVEVDARVGFMERPPFDEPFDLVLNSGVISFAPDPDDYIEGLDPLVKAGGRLVIGDLNPESRGFARRRAERPLLPSRELSGVTRDEMVRRLESRGYSVEFVRYYQNTWPFPELLHRTRSRFVGWAILQWNRLSSAIDAMTGARGKRGFDSWIVGARKAP